ncbi:MAG: hypothetical protein LOY01_14345, partial [Brachybacterium paraconglomeratum]|nr:hypothetical protein [Brachybacterium paraconglomeratum]
PARHHETEPTNWVRGSLEEDPAPLTEVGQVFGIEMFHENAHGRYDMHNRVIAFEQDRTIAWEPGQYGPDGELGTGGWTWRYDLAPAGGAGDGDSATEVTLTYDWSAVPAALKEQFGLPPFPPRSRGSTARTASSAPAGGPGATTSPPQTARARLRRSR